MRFVDWNEWDAFLGTRPDEDLAAIIGCSGVCVLKRRQAVGCPSYRTRVREEREREEREAGR